MELKARCVCIVAMLLVASFAGLDTAHGAGECGGVPVDQAALKLAPCVAATQNPRAAVPPSCCAQVRAIGRVPKCLCAVMLSGTRERSAVERSAPGREDRRARELQPISDGAQGRGPGRGSARREEERPEEPSDKTNLSSSVDPFQETGQ
jgi:hypothetical protein